MGDFSRRNAFRDQRNSICLQVAKRIDVSSLFGNILRNNPCLDSFNLWLMTIFTALHIFLACLCAKVAVETCLNRLNAAFAKAGSASPPECLREVIDEGTWTRSVEYTLAKSWIGLWEDLFDAAVLAGSVAWFLPLAYGAWAGVGPWREALAVTAVLLLLQLPGLPFDWYRQFRLEERFGFNKSTLGLWVADKLKGILLGFVLLYLLLGMLLWIHAGLSESFPGTWWLWGFAAFFLFQLLMFVLWPMLILPLFNKLEPLEEGSLRERLMGLGERAGFRAKAIEVIDGSKRSGHSNAFFTGFGRFRRIVLYDTLIEQLAPEELEAVLAHEIGHYKCGHVPKRLALSALFGFAGFWLLDHLTQANWFYTQLGFGDVAEAEPLGPVLLVLSVASSVFTFWFAPLGNLLSRRHEYEADAFARKAMGGPDSLVGALRKLHAENLANPTPHPLFATVYHSHPTLPEREATLTA